MLFNKTTGSGKPTIIFIHGNSQDHSVWDELTSQPSLTKYTKVAVDMPGHGQSTWSDDPENEYTIRTMSLQLQNFVNQHSANDYILVGLSLATNYIAERAHGFENCKGFFLIGPCIIGENITPAEIIQPNPNFGPTFAPNPTDAELEGLMNDETYHVSDPLLKYFKNMYRNTDPKLRSILGASIAQQEYGDEIGTLWAQNLPVALIYGAEDKLIHPDYLENHNLKMWGDQIIKIPKAGHCCQFDEPAVIAQLIADFAGECFK